MSPASQGGLEIERYIGSNLISSCTRINTSKKNGKGRKPEGKSLLQRGNLKQNLGETFHHCNGGSRQSYPMPRMLFPCECRDSLSARSRLGQFGNVKWTGGMSLISVTDNGKKKRQKYLDRPLNVAVEHDSILRTPLSRLAIHTQGAPLILSERCCNSRKNQNRDSPVRNSRGNLVIRRSNKYKDSHLHANGGTSDCLSVASDESSGSGHSENCLPRIIKPRKRRKKDRKPSGPSTENCASEDTKADKSLAPKTLCSKKTETEEVTFGVKISQKCDIKSKSTVPKLTLSNGSQREGTLEDESHGPKLHHTFEDVTESESPSYGCSPSSCQCHYCDPSGIWFAPAGFFSNRAGSFSAFLTPIPDFNKSLRKFSHSDLALRRSWSEPMSDSRDNGKNLERASQLSLYGLFLLRSNSFSDTKPSKSKPWLEEVRNDRWEPPKSLDFTDSPPSTNGGESVRKESEKKQDLNYGSQCLEVSTEIVTSPDGHRDIEIRFYSSLPSA